MESSSSSMAKVELIQQTIQRLIIEEDDSDGSKEIMGDSDKSFVPLKDGEENRRCRRRHVLAGLLSELDTIRAAEKLQQPELSCDAEEIACVDGELEHIDEPLNKMEVGSCGVDNEEIAQELKRLKRQNFVTHCLLAVMIVLTIGWQISEVSLLWMLKDKASHPFRSLGSMVKGMLRRPVNDQEGELKSFTKEKLNSTKEKFMEAIKQSSTREKLIAALKTIKQSSAREKLIEALEDIEGSNIQGLKIPELLRIELPGFDSDEA